MSDPATSCQRHTFCLGIVWLPVPEIYIEVCTLEILKQIIQHTQDLNSCHAGIFCNFFGADIDKS